MVNSLATNVALVVFSILFAPIARRSARSLVITVALWRQWPRRSIVVVGAALLWPASQATVPTVWGQLVGLVLTDRL